MYDMPPEKHALLSASKAYQWLACPPSAKWEQEFPESTSDAAEEGRFAHALAEDHLLKRIKGRKITTTKQFREAKWYRPAMEEHVATYSDVIADVYNQMVQEGRDPYIYLETQLDLSEWVPDGFGTADCIVIAEGHLHVFDFKYGKGVPVSAEENPQLKLYALGAIKAYDWMYPIDEVTLHIIQPRLGSVTEWSVSREVLEKWGKFIVKPIGEKAIKGEGDFNPGEDQCRFCKCKNRCRAYNDYVLETCQLRFDDLGMERPPNELSDLEIAKMLKSVAEIKRWVTSVEDYARDQAVNNGVKFPGFKLVAGISRRVITDESVVITILDDAGFTTDKTCKLRGITELEDLVGKAKLGKLINDYVTKPPGKPTLVPESDSRPELNDVNTVFTEVKE